jgi:teichuronic acid biosynthesis glycosyltransferase TuaC
MKPAQPLRILHLTAASDAGGLSRYLLDLCHGLQAGGHEVVIAGDRGVWHDRFTGAGYPWIDVPMRGSPIALRAAGRKIFDRLQGRTFDLIHTHYRRPTLVARQLQKRLAIPILYTVHQPRIILRGPWRWMTDFGDHVHAPSQDARRWLVDDARVPDEKITVIPHGIDINRFPQCDEAARLRARAALGVSPDAVVAAFVGRLDVPKNADWMVDVALAAPNATILIAGDGPDGPALRRSISRRKLTDRLRLLGEHEALPVYQAADALLFPSQREGFGLVCAEAMCVGIPVLRTRTGGTEEMIVENVTGRSVPIDRAAFAAAAAAFLSDPASLREMGSNAAKHIRADFTIDRQIEQTISLYRRLART